MTKFKVNADVSMIIVSMIMMMYSLRSPKKVLPLGGGLTKIFLLLLFFSSGFSSYYAAPSEVKSKLGIIESNKNPYVWDIDRSKYLLDRHLKERRQEKASSKASRVQEPSPLKNKSYNSYRERLMAILRTRLDRKKSLSLLNKIDRSIKKIGTQKNDKMAFIRKAYKKYYTATKPDNRKARAMIAQGLDLGLSLHAIVRYTREQFEDDRLRAYALGKIIEIAYLDAKLLMRLLN